MTSTDSVELIKCNHCLFYFFKKTLHFLLHYSINKNTWTESCFFILCFQVFTGINLIRPWKVNPPAPPSPAHSLIQYAHSKSQHFKSLAHIKKKSFSRKTLIIS